MSTHFRTRLPHLINPLLLLAVTGAITFAFIRTGSSPDSALLVDSGHGQWIVSGDAVSLRTRRETTGSTTFRRQFSVDRDYGDVVLHVKAYQRFALQVDDELITNTETQTNWREAVSVHVGHVSAGPHELTISVSANLSGGALWVDSDLDQLRSSSKWTTSKDGTHWHTARPVGNAVPRPTDPAPVWPDTASALRDTAIWLGPLFLIGLVIHWRMVDRKALFPEADYVRRLRTLMLFAWAWMAVRNVLRLPPWIGFDVPAHMEYLEFLRSQAAIPLASDGWQMFQSPLYYLLNLPVYCVLKPFLSVEQIAVVLRLFTLACGFAQIEIGYRVARLATSRPGQQAVTLLLSGWLPVSFYISQYVGNEPLCGVLTAFTVLLMLKFVMSSDERVTRSAAIVGAVWGLAMLTKVTPFLLGPILVAAVVTRSNRLGVPFRNLFAQTATLFGTAVAVCGWYYARNWLLTGRPFIGGGDSSRGIDWWQMPGYRTLSQFSITGEGIVSPMFSGLRGLWDGLYSTFWTDGCWSGAIGPAAAPPWPLTLLVVAAPLGILPALLILTGMIRSLCPSRSDSSSGSARFPYHLLTFTILIYMAATAYLFLGVPVYSVTKASYMLGLLPCFGLLAGYGFDLWRRSRVALCVTGSWLTCWSITVFLLFTVHAPATV